MSRNRRLRQSLIAIRLKTYTAIVSTNGVVNATTIKGSNGASGARMNTPPNKPAINITKE